MGLIDSGSKSSRLLASRRYTHNTYTSAQESFTNVLDLRSEEVYTQAAKIPSSGLPFSGSSQSGSFYTDGGENILKYWYRHKLTKSNVNNEVWFFLSPQQGDSGVGAQLINDNQEVNFVSPKYSISSLATSTVEDSTPGYLAVLYKAAHSTSASLDSGDIVSTNDYVFDYKTGVVQFLNADKDPSDSEYVYMSVYQYVGNTLATGLELDGSVSGSSTSTGSFGHVVATGPSLTVAGGSLILGEDAYSLGTNYVGIKTSFHTGSNDYMIISGKSDGSTYISAKDNSGVEIRGGGNRSTNSIIIPDDTYIKLGGSATTLLRPESDNTTDLGSSTLRYKDLHLSGDVSSSGHISGSSTSTGSFGKMEATTIKLGGTEVLTTGTELNYLSGITSDIKEAYDTIGYNTTTGVITMTEIDGGTDTVDIGVGTGDSPTFSGISLTGDGSVTGSLVLTGTLTAQEYVVSSSVTYLTQSFSSGSTIFGDTSDDTHQFTGSAFISSSITVSQTGSFGRVETSVLAGNSPLIIESDEFNLSSDGTISGSSTSLGSFGSVFTATHITASGNISGSSTSTGSIAYLNIGGTGTTDGGTILRAGETQVAAGANLGDQGARYVFNVDAANPQVGVGIIAQNHNPHHLSILNKTYRSDGNFNYGFTLNQDNSGNAEIYVANNKNIELTGGTHGHMELTRGTANLTLGGEVFPTGGVSGSLTSTGSFGAGFIDNKLGIGISSPETNLHLGTSRTFKLGTGTTNTTSLMDIVANSGTYAFQVWDDNSLSTPRFSIERTGKVGIGKDAQYGLLDVAGTIQALGIEVYQTGSFHWDMNSGGATEIFMTNKDSGNFTLKVGGNVTISATNKLYLDGGGNTYFYESSADNIKATVGGTDVLDITTTKISGSSTSLGSFGSVYAATHITASGNISGSSTSTGSMAYLNIGGTGTTDGGTILRAGETQVAAGANLGDQGARYVFNVDAANPHVGIGIMAQNHNPHHLSILNKSYRADGNFNYGFTLNQNNSGQAEIYVGADRVLNIDGDGNITFGQTSGTKNAHISGSSTSTGSFGHVHIADGLTGLGIGNDNDLLLYHDGSNSYIKDSGTGNLNYMGGTQTFQNAAGSKTMMVLNAANSVDLNFNNSTKFQTTNIGVSVTGEVRASSGTTITGSLYVSGSYGSDLGAISASGDIVADGDIIAYNASDKNLKDNIQVIKGSLDKIGDISGVEFDWNEKSPGWAQERGHDVGVIAQEVQKVLPEIVTKRKNGYLGVDYKRLVPLLIESIKELKEEVEILKKKVN